MRFILIFLITFISISVFAEDCEKQPNMGAVRACLEAQSASSFETQYESLINVLKKKKLTEAENTLIKSQQAWLEYRNASCRYTYHIAASAKAAGYPQDFETNCIADFNTSREKILTRYIKLCEKNKTGCDLK